MPSPRGSAVAGWRALLASGAARPVEAGVVAVAPGVVPDESVVSIARAKGGGGGEAAGHEVLDVVEPGFRAITPLDALDLHVEHSGDTGRAPAALLRELDGDGAGGEPGRDQPRQAGHGPTGAPGEDLLQGALLLDGGLDVDVDGGRPAPLTHGTRRVNGQPHQGPGQANVTGLTALDREHQGYVARPLRRNHRRPTRRIAW